MIQRVLALIVLAVALLTLLEYVLGRSLGTDELLFRDYLSPRYPGRMAPLTAGSFAIASVALLMQGSKLRLRIVAQRLLVLAALGPMLGIVGYLYAGVPLLTVRSSSRRWPFIPVSDLWS